MAALLDYWWQMLGMLSWGVPYPHQQMLNVAEDAGLNKDARMLTRFNIKRRLQRVQRNDAYQTHLLEEQRNGNVERGRGG